MLRVDMRGAIPDYGQARQSPWRENEFTARIYVLAIVTDDRGDPGRNGFPVGREHNLRTEMELQPLRNVLSHGERLPVVPVPPASLHHRGSNW